MTERKELKNYSSDYIRCVADNCDNDDPCFWQDFYIKDDVDPLLDKYEARIKELEARITELEFQESEDLKTQMHHIELLHKAEARIKELEEQLKEKH